MEGHTAPHACNDGQVGRRHTRAHEEHDVLVADHGKTRHKFPEAALRGSVCAIEGVDHDVAVPTPPATRDLIQYKHTRRKHASPKEQSALYDLNCCGVTKKVGKLSST